MNNKEACIVTVKDKTFFGFPDLDDDRKDIIVLENARLIYDRAQHTIDISQLGPKHCKMSKTTVYLIIANPELIYQVNPEVTQEFVNHPEN